MGVVIIYMFALLISFFGIGAIIVNLFNNDSIKKDSYYDETFTALQSSVDSVKSVPINNRKKMYTLNRRYKNAKKERRKTYTTTT